MESLDKMYNYYTSNFKGYIALFLFSFHKWIRPFGFDILIRSEVYKLPYMI